jgi:hypothetical protein
VTERPTARARLAGAIKSHADKKASEGATRFYARVLKVSPLQVELLGRRATISEENLVVTQWVRHYEYQFGLGIGDTVVVDRMPNDDFLVSDVVSTNAMEATLDPASATVVSLTSRNGHIIRSIPLKDATGAIVAVVAGHSALTSDGAPV